MPSHHHRGQGKTPASRHQEAPTDICRRRRSACRENKIAGNVIPELARKALNAPCVGPREVSDLNFLALDKGSNPEGSYSLPGVRWSA
jgi:hypothetical protein